MAEVRRDVGVLARLWLTLLCTLVVLAGTLVYCAGPTGDAAATPVDQEMVAQVRIEGNEAQPIEKVVRFIHTRASRPLEQDKIDEDVRRLNNSRMFVDVKASTQKTDDGTIVIFTVKERAVFRYVRFVGCKGIKRNVLAKETGLKTGEPMDPYLVTEAKRKIVDYYQSKGYARIFVDVFEGDKPGDRGAVFIIHEGAKEKIQWTGFEGNAFASDGQLRTRIKQKPGFLWIFRGEVDRKEIDEDVNRVTDYYRSMGFYKATVGKELHYNEAHSWLSLTYVVDEGPRYQVRKVSVVGAKKFTDKELLTDTKLKPGMFYNRNDMLSDVNRMRDIYGGEGYIFTDIEADTQFQAAPGTLDVVYLVRESNRFRVGKVNPHIKGEYPHTRESTVRNRISQFPGQYVDTREMRASEARLKRSGLFAIDPSRNVMPKVTVVKPGAEKDREKEDIEVAEQPARPAGLRGQSPDPQPEFQSDAPADRSQSQEPESMPQDVQPQPRRWAPPASRWEQEPRRPSDVDVEDRRTPPAGQPEQRVPGPVDTDAAVPDAAAPDAVDPARELEGQAPSDRWIIRGQNPGATSDDASPALEPMRRSATRESQFDAPASNGVPRGTSLPDLQTAEARRQAADNRNLQWRSAGAAPAQPSDAGLSQPYTVRRDDQVQPIQYETSPGASSEWQGGAGAPALSGSGAYPAGSASPPPAGPAFAAPGAARDGRPYASPTTTYGAQDRDIYEGGLGTYSGDQAAAVPQIDSSPSAMQRSAPSGAAGIAPDANGWSGPAATGRSRRGVARNDAAAPAPGSPADPMSRGGYAPFLGLPPLQDPGSYIDPTVPLEVPVEETTTGRLMFSLGVNSDAGLVASAVLDEQNFDILRWPSSWDDLVSGRGLRGAGQQLRMEAMPGTQMQRYAITFTEPYLFDTYQSSISGFYFDRRYVDWTESRGGGRTSLGCQLVPDLWATIAYSGENIVVSNPRVPPVLVPDLAEVMGANTRHGFRAQLAHDTRDNTFLATEGYLMQLGFEQVIGDFNYPRGDVDVRKYFLLRQHPDGSQRHVLSLMARMALSDDNTPIYDRFYLGGFSSLRGWAFRGAAPTDPLTGVKLGGNFLLATSAEYLIPITADDTLRAVVFCDSGVVQPTIRDWTQRYRASVGFGLRITIPAMGPAPIALDFAFPLSKERGDDTQLFSFFVGFFR